ncbi:MAG: hypothetical protein MUF74_05905 [Cypionkella sp.]|nr:hypothetical protein [Cypionkella sp.]
MKKPLALAASALLLLSLSAPAFAGPIESACLRSDRKQATRQLCSCIQQVADQTLQRSDQRKAASFFRDPDRAQQVRMSDRDSDNAFWARYRSFGDLAEAYCAS